MNSCRSVHFLCPCENLVIYYFNILLQRTSVFKYIACGESVDKLIVVHASGFSDLLATPFATKSEPLANSVIIDWALEQKEQLSNRFTMPANAKTYGSLTFTDSENFADGT